ncbi:hypothetical protein ACQP3D_26040, partial [Escherichia coli]
WNKKKFQAGQWWHMTLIPALGMQKQADLNESSLVCKVSSRIARETLSGVGWGEKGRKEKKKKTPHTHDHRLV